MIELRSMQISSVSEGPVGWRRDPVCKVWGVCMPLMTPDLGRRVGKRRLKRQLRAQLAQRASLAAASGSEDDATDVELSAGRETLGAGSSRPAVLGKRRRTSQPQPTGSTEDSGQCSSGGETGTVAGGRSTRRSVRQRVPRAWDIADGVFTDGGASPTESDEDASDQDGELVSRHVVGGHQQTCTPQHLSANDRRPRDSDCCMHSCLTRRHRSQ